MRSLESFMNVKKILPILEWLPNYKSTLFKGDLVAGITVGIVLIPQGIAYALIAGLPPIYGLYCALVPQLIYAVFGSSRQVAIGPVAMDSLIVATGVSSIALVGSEEYISIAILLALMVGGIQFIMGVFNLGFIVNFLSKPVITGFTSAVALIISVNQLKNLLGVAFIQSDQLHRILKDIWIQIGDFSLNTASIGVFSILLIILLKKTDKRIPNALIVVVLGILIMKYFGNILTDVSIVKEIPSGLPLFGIPEFNIDQIRELLPIALTLVMVGYLETISIGKLLEAKQDVYRIRPNQELIALGLSNMFGSLFKAYPSASSFSRSAINEESGARTGMAALISVAMVAITLLFLMPLFYYLPNTVLAAIIIVAVLGLVNFTEAKFLWRANQLDFWLMLATFFATLFLGIEYGITAGVSLSLIVLIFRTSRPHVAELGKVPNSNFYRNIERFEEVIIDEDILVLRFDAQLFYANSSYFRDKLDELTIKKGIGLKLIILDAESINRVDSTGVEMLKERIRYYQKKEVLFYFSGVKGPVRDTFFRSGFLDIIDLQHFYMGIYQAVQFYKTGDKAFQVKYAKYIHQANT